MSAQKPVAQLLRTRSGSVEQMSAARGTGQSQSIATVERALDVLLLIGHSAQPDHGVTEIAGELGLSKAAVHRILTSLRSRGLITLDENTRRYSLGAAALGLGRAYLERQDIRTIAAPELAWLSRESQETATLSIRAGDTRSYIDQVVPEQEIKMEVTLGDRYPLHAGSSSKAFLAFLSEEEIDSYCQRNSLPVFTEQTITDPRRLRDDLASARERGYTSSLGERQASAASVAAPVLNDAGRPVAVVSVCGPLERFKPKAARCAELLLQATARLSERMGHSVRL
ncbi:IclR family transcriptional regulator [Micromonospora carbonacea]|uniref:Transcriptional regulator, IclR family n=1 Tax=Micromonospora carbonacea TaxID=47853 RepID=A0A1C4V8Z9_9ACTN|nr:IclR family transcriptional regulator [Micromonospora carbonacea]SCE80392.1 transcriptional regulator, IclR family [Micromonospora carbonacea]